MKKHKRKPIIMERLSTFKDARNFDMLFWHKAGVQARFAATWKAIDEFYKIRGINGYKLRLQRSVQNIKLKRKTKRPQDRLDLKRLIAKS